jgi:histidinol-phosphate/aromatic aminotransferase/cobyric acid decarboxylase-like protein
VTAQTHGGLRADELAALGVDPSRVVDFSASLNVYGPDPAVLAAVRGADLLAYPDPTGLPARQALARHLDVEPGAVILGHGAVELLWGLARSVAPAPSVIVEPAFGEWRAAVAAVGGQAIAWRAEPPGFAVDLDAVARLVRREGAAAVYIASPGNPSGVGLAAADIAAFARAIPDVTVVLDEAFLSLSDHHADARAAMPGNVVRVRSLTKDHGLAGLRVGYAVAAPPLCRRLEAQRPPWTASAPAQAAIIAAVDRGSFVADSRARLFADRDALVHRLRALGLAPQPTSTIYALVEVGAATELRARLLSRHAVAVRDATSFGLPDHIRVAARPAADVDRLIHALGQELPCARARS